MIADTGYVGKRQSASLARAFAEPGSAASGVDYFYVQEQLQRPGLALLETTW